MNYEHRTSLVFAVLGFALVLMVGGTARAGERAYVGMQPQELPQEAIIALGLDGSSTIMIRDVGRDTPAGRAGVRRGDLLVSVDGESVSSLAQLVSIVQTWSPGDTIALTIMRTGQKHDLELVAGSWPEAQSLKKSNVGQVPALGLTMVGLTGEVREQFSLRWDSEGLLVSLVDPSKGISEIVLRGDIIVQANQQDVWLPQQVIDIYTVAKQAGQRQMLLLIERSGGNKLVLVPVK